MEMEMNKKLWVCCGTVVVLVLASLILVAEGRDQDEDQNSSSSSCVNQLAPCLYYLNGTGNVADSCCDPLKYVIKSRPECLCRMMSNKGSREAEKAGINITQAQQLPGRCGQHLNPLACLEGSPDSESSAEGSAGFFLRPSHTTIITVAICICMIVHNLWLYY